MDKNIIYLGAGENMSEEDKRDRLYTIGFIAVIIVIFVILAIVIGGSYSQNFKSEVVRPVTPSPIQQGSVRSAATSNSRPLPVQKSPTPTDDPVPTVTTAPTVTPTPTAKPTSSPTNTPTPTPSVTPPPTSTPETTPSITPTPDPTPTP